jgi:hypothetical protein
MVLSFYGICQKDADTLVYINFQLLDVTNGKPVSLGHVVNTNQRKGVVADMLGYFKMPIQVGDTLIITAIGFHEMVIPSWGQFTSDSLYYPIRLTPKSYQIKEIRITRFGSYQRFIKEAATIELPISEEEKLQEKLDNYLKKSVTNMKLVNTPPATGGFAFGEDWFSKQNKKIRAKKAEAKKWEVIFTKFSAETVTQLTALEGAEAMAFMEFCDFTEGYLLTASDYEVRKNILDKFEEYSKLKNENTD